MYTYKHIIYVHTYLYIYISVYLYLSLSIYIYIYIYIHTHTYASAGQKCRLAIPEGTKRATSVNEQLPCPQKDLRTGSISRDVVNIMFTEVARLVPPESSNLRRRTGVARPMDARDGTARARQE